MTAPAIGTPVGEDGIFAGSFNLNDTPYGLIVALKKLGEFETTQLQAGPAPPPWPFTFGEVTIPMPQGFTGPFTGAASPIDGLANTTAFAAAGNSVIATHILGMTLGGVGGWYIPSMNELEMLYRAFKPSSDENLVIAQAGANPYSIPAGSVYTAGNPPLTGVAAFQVGGPEAFFAIQRPSGPTSGWAPISYWSSTNADPNGSNVTWGQDFHSGLQGVCVNFAALNIRAVRKVLLSDL